MWDCARCTLQNKEDRKTCEACRARRSSAGPSDKKKPSPKTTSKSPRTNASTMRSNSISLFGSASPLSASLASTAEAQSASQLEGVQLSHPPSQRSDSSQGRRRRAASRGTVSKALIYESQPSQSTHAAATTLSQSPLSELPRRDPFEAQPQQAAPPIDAGFCLFQFGSGRKAAISAAALEKAKRLLERSDDTDLPEPPGSNPDANTKAGAPPSFDGVGLFATGSGRAVNPASAAAVAAAEDAVLHDATSSTEPTTTAATSTAKALFGRGSASLGGTAQLVPAKGLSRASSGFKDLASAASAATPAQTSGGRRAFKAPKANAASIASVNGGDATSPLVTDAPGPSGVASFQTPFVDRRGDVPQLHRSSVLYPSPARPAAPPKPAADMVTPMPLHKSNAQHSGSLKVIDVPDVVAALLSDGHMTVLGSIEATTVDGLRYQVVTSSAMLECEDLVRLFPTLATAAAVDGQRQRCCYVGSDAYATALKSLGCAAVWATRELVANAVRWCAWKLQCAGALTLVGLLAHLLHRYNREYVGGWRSCLRRITEKDAVSTGAMILCIASITNPSPVLAQVELTDGWYSLRAILDSPLSSALASGFLCVGQKVLTCGAGYNGTDAAPPLEVPSSTTLTLSYNGTRPAQHQCKLGFCGPNAGLASVHDDPAAHPVVPVIPASLIHTAGGLVPSLIGTVTRITGTVLVERNAAGRNVTRSTHAELLRSEAYEATRYQQYERLTCSMSREAAGEMLQQQGLGLRDVTPRRMFFLDDGTETVAITVWKRIEGIEELHVGSTIRIFNLVPAKYPFRSAVKTLTPHRTDLLFQAANTATAKPNRLDVDANTVLPLDRMRELAKGSLVDVAAMVVKVMAGNNGDATATTDPYQGHWYLVDDCVGVFASFRYSSSRDSREVAFPTPGEGSMVVLGSVVFDGVDDSTGRDVIQLYGAEFSTVESRPKDNGHKKALARLQQNITSVERSRAFFTSFGVADGATRLPHPNVVLPLPMPLPDDEAAPATLARDDSGGRARRPLHLMTPDQQQELSRQRQVATFQSHPSAFAASAPTTRPSLLYQVPMAPAADSSSATPVRYRPAAAVPSRTVETQTETSVEGPPEAEQRRRILHEFGNINPTQILVTFWDGDRTVDIMAPEGVTRMFALARMVIDGQKFHDTPEKPGEQTASQALALNASKCSPGFRFEFGAGQFTTVRDPNGVVWSLLPRVDMVSLLAAQDDCYLLQLSRSEVIRRLSPPSSNKGAHVAVTPALGAVIGAPLTMPTMGSDLHAPLRNEDAQLWQTVLAHSVVIAPGLWSRLAASTLKQGSSSAAISESPEDAALDDLGRLTEALHDLRRWNAAFVEASDVVWWHAAEWAQVQLTIHQAIAGRLVKLTLAKTDSSALVVRKCFPLAHQVAIADLYAFSPTDES